ncbi:TetR/AcrR family transcriptional regulator [Planotetraspora kaengkrachanensis]|uniref:TetR family transcriptional regulator n=1 Tax=Planotetraspora kaengkrachanensis TaxID=575193 RepID=A0A8J3Q0R3_9ACTN|nr:TetR family transcriptional regulator [Planotetraspora kaengkrachanensis]GIG84585.1 TetR family transcriptional regulator [Planotetraspora kaengkrachanensis]
MTQQEFVRARRPEHKQQRREAILEAARDLAERSGVRNVSLGGVAAAVGLAKSNVVRYFGTREEIYLELAAEAWREWGQTVSERLRTAAGPDDVLAALTDPLAERPLFCDLLSHMSTNLEHNVSVPAARAFKLVVLGVIADLGAQVARVHPDLTEPEGIELVGVATAFAGTLYPVSNPSATLVELYAQYPEIGAACPPFLPTLRRCVAAVAAGVPTLRAAGSAVTWTTGPATD